MSTILEALKRSEAERRQATMSGAGDAPSLPQPASLRWLWLPGLAVLALLAGWVLSGRQLIGPGPVEPQSRSETIELPPADSGSPTLAPDATDDPKTVPSPAAPAAGEGSPDQANASVAEDPVDPPSAVNRPERVAQTPDTPEAEIPDPPAATEPERLTMTPEQVPESEPPARPARVDLTPPRREAKPAVAAPAASAADYPLVSQLPPGPTRALFAEATINVHVWSEEPSKRFVLINLKRHEQGDAMGDGVTIEEIIPEGVVVAVDGERYLWQPQPR